MYKIYILHGFHAFNHLVFASIFLHVTHLANLFIIFTLTDFGKTTNRLFSWATLALTLVCRRSVSGNSTITAPSDAPAGPRLQETVSLNYYGQLITGKK